MILYITDRNIRVDNADNQISYNSDYIAEFHFDDEWDGKIKTARFVQNGEHVDVVLVDDRCEIPPLKTGFVRVGVFTDSMTSTYADVYFKTSIKDGGGNPTEPPEDVYAQLIARIESGMLKGDPGDTPYIGENGNWWLSGQDSGMPAQGPKGDPGKPGEKGAPGKDGNDYIVTEADYEAIAEKSSEKLQPTITELDKTKVGYSEVVNNQLLMYSDSSKKKLLATLDLPSDGVNDVQINGTSIVADGVADIPLANSSKVGVVKTNANLGVSVTDDGRLFTFSAENSLIDRRDNAYRAITPKYIDYAVKSAMCDGKGAEWTAKEQGMARARIGLGERLIFSTTLAEDAKFLYVTKDINGNSFKLSEINIYIHSPVLVNDEPMNGYVSVNSSDSNSWENIFGAWIFKSRDYEGTASAKFVASEYHRPYLIMGDCTNIAIDRRNYQMISYGRFNQLHNDIVGIRLMASGTLEAGTEIVIMGVDK